MSKQGNPSLISGRSGRAVGKGRHVRERGVASVLSMMFLVLFGSLATAMAIASKGNIRTAATHQHVMRAQSAAETGLKVACDRIKEASARFVVANSVIDASYGWKLWSGNLGGTGTYTVLSPKTGFSESVTPAGVASALANRHAADQGLVSGVGVSSPTLGGAMSGVDMTVYRADGWLFTPTVAVEATPNGSAAKPLAFSITYAPLKNGTDIRAIVTGYDFNYSRDGRPITRTLSQDFRFVKRVNQAIVSPSKIMIGKNVQVTGDLGASYTDVAQATGDPMVIKSDFFGLDTALDTVLTQLFTGIAAYDVDHDNRLRVGHPIEMAGLPDNDSDGEPDGLFSDATGDGYVDELDLFINRFDGNGDNRVALSGPLTAGTPAQGASPEFVDVGGNPIDDDLALLIDTANPDRNRNNVYGFVDINRNGRWDAGEPMLDFDAATSKYRDQISGYRDGFIDKRDQYAKVRGRLVFKVGSSTWAAAQGPASAKLRGPIVPPSGMAATSYSALTPELPALDPGTFTESNTALKAAADGAAFSQQVSTQLGVTVAQLLTYVETKPDTSPSPRFLRVDGDVDLDGKPDNWSTAYFEKMPYNSPSYSDWYYRPVYQNMIFRDAKIPMGTNALFKNCTFVGVTQVQCQTDNTHVLWSEYGRMQLETATNKPGPNPKRSVYPGPNFPTMLPTTAKPPTQQVLFAAPEMDKADIPSDQTGRPGYDTMPDPLIIGGTRVTDTKPYSNNLRFHDCLFVGSIVSDVPVGYTQVRNKLQFTGSTRFSQSHPDAPDDPGMNPQAADMSEILKSSMMVPNYSVDIGSFNSPPTQNVQLTGTIVAGVMDMRGNTTLNGALLLTFNPIYGEGPLRDAQGNPIGNPAGFNTTIGYFGPADGDSEALDPTTLPIYNGQKYIGWDLDGDGLTDLGPDQTPTAAQIAAGATRVPFYGYGQIHLNFDPKMNLPNGLLLPMQVDALAVTYHEGNP